MEFTNSIGMKLRLIPPGEYLMGSTKSDIAAMHEDGIVTREGIPGFGNVVDAIEIAGTPVHRVHITKPYYLGCFEVTYAEFEKFVDDTGFETEVEKNGKGGTFFDGGQWHIRPDVTWRIGGAWGAGESDWPVVQLSWRDTLEFCRWLTKRDGITYRLPTEAEWEYACRAGSTALFSCGDDVSAVADYAWCVPTGSDFVAAWYAKKLPLSIHPVGKKLPNAFGLYDMHGNVHEWCRDWFAPDYADLKEVDDPPGQPTANSACCVVEARFTSRPSADLAATLLECKQPRMVRGFVL